MDDLEKLLKWAFEDPLVDLLLQKSTLTKTQLEVLLIDMYSKNVEACAKKYSKRLLRKTSKGAFFRSLRQAKNNVARALFTVLLLGYLGILSSPYIEPYVELGERLRALTEEYVNKNNELRKTLIKLIEKALQELVS